MRLYLHFLCMSARQGACCARAVLEEDRIDVFERAGVLRGVVAAAGPGGGRWGGRCAERRAAPVFGAGHPRQRHGGAKSVTPMPEDRIPDILKGVSVAMDSDDSVNVLLGVKELTVY